VTNPHTKERIEIDLDVGGRATITVPAELMANVREVLSKSRFIYSGGNSLFHGDRPGLYTTITLPPGADVESVQKALDAAP
jgi:hypothetical protein